jgi:hypothetical protein
MLFWMIILAVAVAWWYMSQESNKEKYTLDDPKYDTSSYTEAEAVVDHDLMEQLVLATNEEITRRTDDCSYIIETTAVKRYVKSGSPDVYKCMFMCVRAKGFAYGFSVVSTLSVRGDDVRVLSVRSQPLQVDAPTDVSPYVQDVAREFLDFDIVKEKSAPTVGELDAAKENLQ